MVADHGVERVGSPVHDEAGNTRDGAPEVRGDHGVAGVLGHGFDHGAGDLVGRQVGGVPSDEVAKPLPRAVQVACAQKVVDGLRLPFERASTEHRPRDASRQQDARQRTFSDKPERRHAADQDQHEEDPARAIIGVHPPFERSRGVAEAGDGMEAARVADEPVGGMAKKQARRTGDQAAPSRVAPRTMSVSASAFTWDSGT